MSQNQSLRSAFINAYNGVRHVVTSQRNARIHTLVTVIVLLVGILFHISNLEWIAIIFAIGFVWASECLNTGIEKLTDLVSPNYHALAKLAKDSSAAAVLFASMTAVAIGFIIFIPKLIQLISLL